MSAPNDSATPNTKTQVRRRLTALSYHAGGFRSAVGEPALQFVDDPDAFGRAHDGPARNLVDGPAAAETQPGTGIESADFDAGAFDHRRSRGRFGSEHRRGGPERNRTSGSSAEQWPFGEPALFLWTEDRFARSRRCNRRR